MAKKINEVIGEEEIELYPIDLLEAEENRLSGRLPLNDQDDGFYRGDDAFLLDY